MTERYKYRNFLPLNGRIHSNPPFTSLTPPLPKLTIMSTSAELKARLEAIRVERERQERETREQEERELQRLVEEERKEEEERARREQQREDEEKKRAEETEAQRKAEEERVAGEQRGTTEKELEGSEGEERQKTMEAEGESWEDEMAWLQAAARAGSSRDGEEEYQAMESTCWNCRHRKLVCERPE